MELKSTCDSANFTGGIIYLNDEGIHGISLKIFTQEGDGTTIFLSIVEAKNLIENLQTILKNEM